MHDAPLAIAFAVMIGIYMPFKAVLRFAKGKAPGGELPVEKLRPALIQSLWILAVIALFVAWDTGLTIFRPWNPSITEVVLGCAAFALFLGARHLLKKWMRAGGKRIDSRLRPRTREELPIWAAISITAGITEEIIYRGVLYQILLHFTGQWWIAGLLVALVFAIAHINQGVRTTAFIFLIAAVFQGLVTYAGSLYTAMVVHAVYDYIVGILALREKPAEVQA